MSDYYETLGLKKGADETAIKKSYRKLALQYHPDRNAGDKGAEEKFKKISEAYAVLSDADKRKQYDMHGDSKFHQNYSQEDIFRGADFNSIFEEMNLSGGGDIFSRIFGGAAGFGGGRPGGRGGFSPGFGGQRAQAKGQDVEFPLQIGFMESYTGSERQVSFRLGDGSETDLKVKVPAGARDGSKLRVSGKGAASPYGGAPGDLYIIIQVAGHPKFERVADDIESKIHLKISEAFLGCTRDVETPDGTKAVKVPAGVKPGTRIRLKSLGFPHAGKSTSRGDLYAIVEFDIPQKLNPKQLEAIEALAGVDL